MADTLSPLPLTKLAYQTWQQGKNYFSLAHKEARRQLFTWFNPSNSTSTPSLPMELLQTLSQRVEALLEVDWQEAQAGVYPLSVLFESPWLEMLLHYPGVWFDMPGVWRRTQAKQHQEFSDGIDTEGYPQYYLRNFHYQTDGYLSDESANLYDVQVDLLFHGTTDAMRRRILSPLKQGIAPFDLPQKQLRLLDVACGTGRMLKLLQGVWPQAQLFGVDLSPAYLRKAQASLGPNPLTVGSSLQVQLTSANAEELPYRDRCFHGLTCVFLFHELPGPVRQRVIQECFRVLQPGGTFVICDSIQAIDSPEFAPMMENFQTNLHEPFYQDYIQDDLVQRLEQVGFEQIQTAIHFVSKYWMAHKPA
jgi:ubiquinone/menaquinone biosynthesis C-methylase UbiE